MSFSPTMPRVVHCAAIFALLITGPLSAVEAQSYRPGDQIVVITNAKLTFPEESGEIYVSPGRVLKVGGVNEKWLWVNHETPGWIHEQQVMPLGRAAVERLTEMIKKEPIANLYSGRADVWRNLGDLNEAMKDCNEAIRLSPTGAAYYNNRATVWQAMGDHEKAIADYDKALQLDPEFATAFYCRGTAWKEHGDLQKALADYDQVLQLDPLHAFAYNGRGNTWWRLGNLDKALADLQEALRLDPKGAYIYSNRGLVWRARGDLQQALADYSRAIELDPNFVMAYNNRGNIWRSMNEHDRAIEDYNAALALDPRYVNAYLNRGHAWRASGEVDRAIADYTEALRLDPKKDDALIHRAGAWVQRGEYDDALRDYNDVIALRDRDVSVHFSRAVMQMLLLRLEAVHSFQSVIDLEQGTGALSPYSVILGNIAARKIGDELAARQFIDNRANQLRDAWPYPVVRFLRGELDEAGLLAAATEPDQQTEARCYIGLTQALSGEKDAALGHLRWVKENGNQGLIEYAIAVAEMNQLEGTFEVSKK